MAISEVIKFEGSPDVLVWKHPQEDFNTTSQLIVDETHEALLVINGNAADLFGPGRRTLTTANIPILSKIITIPTGGKTPFPCKVFFINKVHQMDMLWGTQGAIPLEDPLYDIFMHVMLHGSISVSVDDSRKFMLKLVGFRDSFSSQTLVSKFRGIISSEVKDAISKIMINAALSYFMISANLKEISEAVRERLSEIFLDYGISVEFFNIETIEVPEKDYAEISQAKKLRTSRLIQGYTWQEEREMMIMEKYASNQGTMGTIGGVMGGAMGGVVMGTSIAELARNALKADGTDKTMKNVQNASSPVGRAYGTGFDARGFLAGGAGAAGTAGQSGNTPAAGMTQTAGATNTSATADTSAAIGTASAGVTSSPAEYGENTGTQNVDAGQQATAPNPGTPKFCPECGAALTPGAKFCSECGTKIVSNVCPGCGQAIKPGMKFCPECGYKLN